MYRSIPSDGYRPYARRTLTLAVLSTLVWLSSSGLSLAQAPGTTGASLPSLGDGFELSVLKERRIGDRIAVSVYRDPDYVDDPVLVDYVQGIWQPLMSAARARGELNAELDQRFAWEMFLVRDRSVNAFALPGGYFGLHLGLIGAVSNADELAAVLGHELTHVTQRHIARLMTQQSKQTPLVIAAMILGVLAAGKNAEVGNAAIVGGQAALAQNQLNFSRDMEREADRIGFGVMTDAGFESRGVASMFEKLQQASRLNDNGAFPYLRSHPLNTQRIAEAQSRVQLAAAEASRPTAEKEIAQGQARVLHAMMAARARVLAAPGVDGLRAMLAEAQRRPLPLGALQTPASADNVRDAGILYAAVLASAQLRDFTAARAFMAALRPLAAAGTRAGGTLDLLAIEIDLQAGAPAALATSARFANAGNRAEVLLLARALLASQRAAEVSGKLQTWVTSHPRDAQAWQLLATAYGSQGQAVRAIRAEAEGRAAQLDYPAALDRFKAAQAMMRSNPASADFVEGSIIDTRARQLESLVKEQALQEKVDR